ncbi:unnamed protein product [Ectocarpus sp. CCAP 1310/34]|nr:unnamed protein product [Ectocarpus sp. CCAP 1310/34]
MPTDPELRWRLDIMYARIRMDNDDDVTGINLSFINPDPSAATVVPKSSSTAASPDRKSLSSVADPDDSDDGDDKSPAAANIGPASTATAAPAGSSQSSAVDPKASAPANVGNNPALGMSMADLITGKAREARDVGSAVNVDGDKGGGGGRSPSTALQHNTWTGSKNKTRNQQQRGQCNGQSNGTGENTSNGNGNNNGNRNNNGNSNNNSGNSNSDRSSYTHPGPTVPPRLHPEGQVLLARLLNPARTSMAYASPTDGSVILATAIGNAPRDADGNTTGPVTQNNRTLLTANPRKMSKVRALRSENIVAGLEKKRVAREGRTLREGKLATLMGFMPFGKHGFLRRRAREHVEAYMGEATLSITNKGGLGVSVDGIVVLRKSGPYCFGFRRTDRSYELRVTEAGVVISRRGMYDWGLKAQDP